MEIVGDRDEEETIDELILKDCPPDHSLQDTSSIPFLTPQYVREPLLKRSVHVSFDNVDLQNCTLNRQFEEYPETTTGDMNVHVISSDDEEPGTMVDLVSSSGDDSGDERENRIRVSKEDVDMEVDVDMKVMELEGIFLVDEQGIVTSSCSLNVNMYLRCIQGDDQELNGVPEVRSDGITEGVGGSSATVAGKRKVALA